MSSLIPHDYRYKISSPTPVDKEPFFHSSFIYDYLTSTLPVTFDVLSSLKLSLASCVLK